MPHTREEMEEVAIKAYSAAMYRGGFQNSLDEVGERTVRAMFDRWYHMEYERA